MAGDTFGRVDNGIWEHHRFIELDEPAKIIALYLRTCRHQNMIGCYFCPAEYIQASTRYPIDTVFSTLKTLKKNRFALHCETTNWVLIPKHLVNFPVRGPQQSTKALSLFESIPREFAYITYVYNAFIANVTFGKTKQGRAVESRWDTLSDTLSDTVSIPHRKGYADKDVYVNNNKKPEIPACGYLINGERIKPPPNDGKHDKETLALCKRFGVQTIGAKPDQVHFRLHRKLGQLAKNSEPETDDQGTE